MADECGSSGIKSRYAVDLTAGVASFANFTAADQAYALATAESLIYEQPHLYAGGLDGTSQEASEFVRKTLEIVNGDVPLHVTPETLQTFIPLVTGQPWNAGVSFTQANPPPAYHAIVDRDAALYVYDSLRINTCNISGTVGEPLRMTLGHIGRSRLAPIEAVIANVDQWPTGLDVDKSVPYNFDDVAITVEGNAHDFRSFQITHDNKLAPVYFGGTQMCGVQRTGGNQTTQVELIGKHTYATIQELMRGADAPGALDLVMTLTHVNPAFNASFRFQAWQVPEKDPPGAEGELLLPSVGAARTLDGGASNGSGWIINNDNVA